MSAWLLVSAAPARALDSDADGLPDADERARARTVPFGAQQVITTAASLARSVSAADLDGDGDLDVLSASAGDGKIAWYENRLDQASSDFSAQRVITTAAVGADSVFSADLDGDGDPDVLSASGSDGKIAWYENRLDEPSADFGAQQLIGVTDSPRSVFAADLDGDGDPDVLVADGSTGTGGVAWYETRRHGSHVDFGARQSIDPLDTGGANAAIAADLDGDGDLDVLSAQAYAIVAWHENRLDESSHDFAPRRVVTNLASSADSIFAVDLDGDGDPDVLSASWLDNTLAWYENRLNEPSSANFGQKRIITTAAVGARTVFAADLDGDGDPDVLTALQQDEIGWFENRLDELSADFGPARVITTAAHYLWSVFAVDLDGDGDADALSASNDNEIAWYENPGTNPFDPDSDDDGLSDGAEVGTYATDPLNPDTDGDALTDGDEVNLYATDPIDPDSDADGLSDGDEVDVYGTNPLAADTDGDGLPDAYEIANGFDPLLAGDETQDPDGDGLDNRAELAAGTDPRNPDSDGDGLSDGDELDVYATNPLVSDTDGDGVIDGREVSAGTDPLDPTSRPQRQPALFQASFIMHAFGNDITSGSASPSTFTALPLGYDCRSSDPYWPKGTPRPHYCAQSIRQRGHPATGPFPGGAPSISTTGAGGVGAGIALPKSALGVSAVTGFLPLPYYELQSNTYATFVNDAGEFFAGGGPAAAAGPGQKIHTGMGQRAGTWIINEGTNGFGGAMGLLGRFGARVKYVVPGVVGTYVGTGSWNMVVALGRVPYATPTGYTSLGKASNWLNPHDDANVYTNSYNGKQSTLALRGSGTPWTTGSVTLYAKAGVFTTILHRAGYDTTTPSGARNLQLVTPALTHWIGPGYQTHTGHIGILKLTIVPEPGAWLSLAAGLTALLVLRRIWQR